MDLMLLHVGLYIIQDKHTGYQMKSDTAIYLVILILLATCFGPSSHHLASLQKLQLSSEQFAVQTAHCIIAHQYGSTFSVHQNNF